MPLTGFAALSCAHFSVQAPPLQLTEHEPVHVMVHFAFVQPMLLLGPAVSSQVLFSAHVALQERPHVPTHDWSFAQASEQLSLPLVQLADCVHPENDGPQAARSQSEAKRARVMHS